MAVVAVAGSTGPWRPGMGGMRMQDWLVQLSAFEARKKVVVSSDADMFEALIILGETCSEKGLWRCL